MEMHTREAIAQQCRRAIGVARAQRVGQRRELQRLRLPITALQLHAMAGEHADILSNRLFLNA